MSLITCPNCKKILHKEERLFRCQNGHSFDIAKEGYVNLLLANKKKTLQPGDNKSMINAREDFLSAGHYDFLIEQIESEIKTLKGFSFSEYLNLLDLGCGTGYYTRNIFKTFRINRVGVDVSKVGIAKASKTDKDALYAVGSVFDLAILSNGVDLVLNIFSPVDLEEVIRILKPGGLFIKVIPIGNHMKEVAELVYDNFIPHQSKIEEGLESNDSFKIVSNEMIQKTIRLDQTDLQNFVAMTPYIYKFKEGQVSAISEMEVTISFKIIISQIRAKD